MNPGCFETPAEFRTWLAEMEWVRIMTELGGMQPTGLAPFQARKEARSGVYSHEQGDLDLPEPYQGLLRMAPAGLRKICNSYQKESPSTSPELRVESFCQTPRRVPGTIE